MWIQLRTVFTTLSTAPGVRAIVLTGAGERAFTGTLSLLLPSSLTLPPPSPPP